MVDMNDEVISSSEEANSGSVTYQNLDIVNCAVATTILAENDETAVFDYAYEEFYNNNHEFQENTVELQDVNCKIFFSRLFCPSR